MQDMDNLPEPVDFSYRYGDVAKARKPSIIKKFYKYYVIPGIGNLAGGLPNPSFFPVDELNAQVAPCDRFAGQSSASTQNMTIPKYSSEPDNNKKIDIATGFQYGQASGYPALCTWVNKLVGEMHTPRYKGGPQAVMSYGNTDALNKTIQMFSNEWCAARDPVWARDGILVEEFTYASAYQNFEPRGLNCVAVTTDRYGMAVDGARGLRKVLANWDPLSGKRPHLMYIIPTGQNPMGTVMSNERKQAIYDICHEFDVIIIEDDPYWFLQFDADSNDSEAYKSSLLKTFVSMDVDGRVVRLDTFSKLFAPGSRLGWITAQPEILEKLVAETESATQGASGIVQSLFAKLILNPENCWDTTGIFTWCRGLNNKYRSRCALMCDELDRCKEISLEREDGYVHVDKINAFEFIRPQGGMFLWLHMKFKQHPKADKFTIQQLSDACWKFLTTQDYRVVVAPGFMFGGTQEIRDTRSWEYYRLCFGAVEESLLVDYSSRFANGVEGFWNLSAESIAALLEEP